MAFFKSGTKLWFADKTTKLMVGMGKFAKDGAGPNICAVWKPPMSGDGGVSISSMEGKMEITAKTKLSIKGENIKNYILDNPIYSVKRLPAGNSSQSPLLSSEPGVTRTNIPSLGAFDRGAFGSLDNRQPPAALPPTVLQLESPRGRFFTE